MSRMKGFGGTTLVAIAACVVGWGPAEAVGYQTYSPAAGGHTTADDGLRLAHVAPAPAPQAAPPDVAPGAAGPSRAAQPPATPPSPMPPAPTPPEQGLFAFLLGRGPQAGPSPRLAGVPNMFGDLFGLGGTLVSLDPAGTAPLPLAAASRRVKVAENNKALPMDRVHFMYNHFHHALEFESEGVGRVFPVDRFTIAAEKTLVGGLYSVEVRMPFASGAEFDTADFGVSSGEIGNLAVLLKRVVFRTDTTSVVLGLAVDLPTGSNVNGFVIPFDYTLHNEAVHLSPYAGFLWEPNNRLFYHGFLQVDVPANSNTVDVRHPVLTPPPGSFHEPTTMFLDFGTGYWLYRNPRAPCLTGVACLLEVHYATTLSDSGTLFFTDGTTELTFGNPAGGVDEANFTVGVHAEFWRNTLLRAGAVFPLRDDDDRSFDSEIQVQVERRF